LNSLLKSSQEDVTVHKSGIDGMTACTISNSLTQNFPIMKVSEAKITEQPAQVQNHEISSTKFTNLQDTRTDNIVASNESVVISDDDEGDSPIKENDESKRIEQESLLTDWDIVDNSEKEVVEESGKSDAPYSLVCIHAETFRVSNVPTISLSQVGCVTAINTHDKDSFFQPIKPNDLEYYLENYKMEGDLLKALHMTDENGRFEFRGQFEIKRKEKNKVYAVTENEALEKLADFLDKMAKVVLLAVDEDTIKLLLEKLSQLKRLKKSTVVGFATWAMVLKYGCEYNSKYDCNSDLEDFYSNNCNGKISGYISTYDVANFLRKAMRKLCGDYAKKEKPFRRNKFIEGMIDDVNKLKFDMNVQVDENKPPTVEVFSSFRPEVSARIGIEKMDTIEISSGEESDDSDIDVLRENVSQVSKRKNMDMLSIKRKFPFHFPERTLRKRPYDRSITNDPIIISSDEEDDEVGSQTSPPKLKASKFDTSLANTNAASVKALLDKNSDFPKCYLCFMEFDDSDALDAHTEDEHMNCKVCKLKFNVLLEAVLHRKVHLNLHSPIAEDDSDNDRIRELENSRTCGLT